MRIITVVTVVTIFLALGCGKQKQAKSGLNLAKMSVPVRVARAKRGTVNRVLTIGGSVKAVQEQDIVPDVPGRIAQVLVKEGDMVKKGQVLAILDTRQTKIRLKQAQAAVQAAQARFENLKEQMKRTKALYRKGAVTKQQLDAVVAGYKAARAGVLQAQAARDLALHAINVSKMKAPFDGVITGKFKDPGDMINPLMQSLSPLQPNGVVRLARLDKVFVDGFVADRDWAWVKKGMTAFVTTDAWPKQRFKGVVTKIDADANPMTRTFGVELTVENRGLKLRPGMYARMVLTRASQTGVVVPLDALVNRDGGFVVFTVEKGTAHLHKVKVGLKSLSQAIILKGIKTGDEVVVQGNIALRDGTPIRVIQSLKDEF